MKTSATWTLAKKDLRLLVRDPRALVILLVMPFIFILVLGVSLGEGFGKPEADKLRVSVLNLDEGVPRYFDQPVMIREGVAWLAALPGPGGAAQTLGAAGMVRLNQERWFPRKNWGEVVLEDLGQSADISVEIINTREEARQLVRNGNRAAVLILGPDFSRRVSRSSLLAGGWEETFRFSALFPQAGLPINLALAGFFDQRQDVFPLYVYDGINPYYRDGVELRELDVEVLRDPTQKTAAAIIDQVAQGTMLRVVLPWMIGRAFSKVGDPEFIDLLSGENVQIRFNFFKVPLGKILAAMSVDEKRDLGNSLQNALQRLFAKYNLTAKTWASLTKSVQTYREGARAVDYRQDGSGILKYGALRYQLLVPSYIVMFAFFLVLTTGWMFVAERRQGTMKRLCVAPLTRTQIVLGKLIPCLLMSLAQGFLLLGLGKLIFGMSLGPQPLWLIPVVVSTSLAAMGLALFVAAISQTETQVSVYGTLLVLVLAGLSGSMMGDRATMPEQMQRLSLVTPHAWALDAYRQLLTNPTPELELVIKASLVLTCFGIGFVLLAWWFLRLE